MRYLLSILVFAVFLSGCSTTYHSLSDRLKDSAAVSPQGGPPADASKEPSTRPASRPPAPEVETLQASYGETSLFDRF